MNSVEIQLNSRSMVFFFFRYCVSIGFQNISETEQKRVNRLNQRHIRYFVFDTIFTQEK